MFLDEPSFLPDELQAGQGNQQSMAVIFIVGPQIDHVRNTVVVDNPQNADRQQNSDPYAGYTRQSVHG